MDARPRHRQTAPPDSRERPLVVGVGPDGRAASAVVWAAAEANRTGQPLTLVTAGASTAHGSHDLAGVARQLTLRDVRHVVEQGHPASVVLEASDAATLLVVGRRGMSLFRREIVGGTSLTVAVMAPCPVVIVPEEWMQPEMSSAPIVLGLGPSDLIEGPGIGAADPQRDVIVFAFERAAALRVPLVAVSAWTPPPTFLHNAAALARCREQFAERLARRLDAWRSEFPDVEVRAVSEPAPVVTALLEASADAQLIVVGRRSGATPPSFGLGTRTRGVIRRAHVPVAVVPISNA